MPTDPITEPSPETIARARLERARAIHWGRTRRMSLLLLTVWLVTGFGTVFFARELARFEVFGWPLSFYMAAQGAALVSLTIIAVYAWRMRRLDRDYHAALAPRA